MQISFVLHERDEGNVFVMLVLRGFILARGEISYGQYDINKKTHSCLKTCGDRPLHKQTLIFSLIRSDSHVSKMLCTVMFQCSRQKCSLLVVMNN